MIEKANYFARHGYEVTIVTEAQMGRPLAFPLDSSVKHIDMGLDFNKQYSQGPLGRLYTYKSLMKKYSSFYSRLWAFATASSMVPTL